MRKYVYINSIVLTLLTLIIVCCESIFVPDPIDPRLPKYTENGNNVAGAFINQEVWRSQKKYGLEAGMLAPEEIVHQMINIKIDSIKNSMILHFDGLISNDSTTLEFHLVGLNIYSFNDLVLLKDKKIQLDGTSNMGVYIRHRGAAKDIKYFKDKGIGQLYLKNVKVAQSNYSATISGTFGFTIYDSTNITDEISYGRFDCTIQYPDNFTLK